MIEPEPSSAARSSAPTSRFAGRRLEWVSGPLVLLGLAGLMLARTRFAPGWTAPWASTGPSGGALVVLALLLASTWGRTPASLEATWRRLRGPDRPSRTRLPLRRRLAFGFLVQTALLVLVVGVLELVLPRPTAVPRIFGYAPEEDVLINLPDLDTVTDYRVYDVPFERQRAATYRVRTDADGCRIGASDARADARPHVLMLVGDSFGFGCHAEEEHTIGGLLARAFPDTRVVNASVCGACSHDYPALVAHQRDRKKVVPETLVVTLYVDMQIGDVPRSLARLRFGGMRAFEGYSVWPARFDQLQGSWLSRQAFFVERSLRSTSATYNALAPGKSDPRFAEALAGSLRDEDFAKYRGIVAHNLERAREAANLPAERVALVLIPSYSELVYLADEQRGRSTSAERAAFLERSIAFWDGAAASLSREGYVVCDPRAAVNALYLGSATYPFTVDGHLDRPRIRRRG